MFGNYLPEQPFWMIHGLGQSNPTHKHSALESAVTEAKRLARAHPGIAFVVLRSVGAVIKDDLRTITYREPFSPQQDEDVPF